MPLQQPVCNNSLNTRVITMIPLKAMTLLTVTCTQRGTFNSHLDFCVFSCFTPSNRDADVVVKYDYYPEAEAQTSLILFLLPTATKDSQQLRITVLLQSYRVNCTDERTLLLQMPYRFGSTILCTIKLRLLHLSQVCYLCEDVCL